MIKYNKRIYRTTNVGILVGWYTHTLVPIRNVTSHSHFTFELIRINFMGFLKCNLRIYARTRRQRVTSAQ